MNLDFIKPIDDAIARAKYGHGVQLTWSSDQGWSGDDAEQILNRYGIKTYVMQLPENGGDFGIHVREEQAEWAEYLLLRAGCPLTGERISERNAGVQPGRGMPEAWGVEAKPVGFRGSVLGGMRPKQKKPSRRDAVRAKREGEELAPSGSLGRRKKLSRRESARLRRAQRRDSDE